MKDITDNKAKVFDASLGFLQGKWHDMWLVAYTKPRQEQIALHNLERQSFEVYLPLYKKFKKTEIGPVPVFEPMFSRYIFFRQSKQDQSIESVRSTKGISHVVRFGAYPSLVSTNTVCAIKEFEVLQNNATLTELSNFKIGQKVRLKNLTMSALNGLVHNVSKSRVTVLLEILGRPTLVQVESHHIEND